MIHVPRLKDENATELFLGFRIGTVRSCHFAVLPIQGQGGLRPLKRFSTGPVPAGAKMVVIFKACIEHGVSLALSHAIEFAFVVVAQTDVFQCSSPLRSWSQRHRLRAGSSSHGQDRASSKVAAGETIPLLFPEVGRKETRALRRPHPRRWRPSSPLPPPPLYQRLSISKNPPFAP